MTFDNLAFVYNGSPQSATAETNPPGLSVSFTYNGSSTAPTDVGSYTVVATINDPNYQGSATGTLVISAAPDSATDTPTMPQWGLLILATLLVYFSNREKKPVAVRSR